ncbi:hypothetical protein ABGB14_19565 [Nonomuraea sp. B10E15]|uniref:hypothetical protein n=1 Tax=Nonomuraea sp. B10E15 TaxID=3153560 RepID=UPI00325CB776
MHLAHASVERLPGFGDPLDAVLAVNSVGMWPDPVERLREPRRLLRPAGRSALVGQPRCPGATRDTTVRAARELRELLTEGGFVSLRVETFVLDPPVACVLARSPGGMPSCPCARGLGQGWRGPPAAGPTC